MPNGDYFFYGTLMDADIRRVVLGGSADCLAPEPAVLAGYRRVRAAGGNYPILLRQPRGRVEGILVRGIPAPGRARLAHFESSEYRLAAVPVRLFGGRSAAAAVFLPARALIGGKRAWRFLDWRRRHKRHFMSRAIAWMAKLRPLRTGTGGQG